MKKREAGVLLPLFSLPGEEGIGTMGKEARAFIDFLAETGNRVWQILPMGPTGYGDSPYQSFSAFAGNPYFIDLESLKEEGLLEEADLEKERFKESKEKISYGLLYELKHKILRKAYENWLSKGGNLSVLLEGRSKENFDYCLFMALKDFFNGIPWLSFEKPYRDKDQATIEKFLEEHKQEVGYYAFLQMQYDKQWQALLAYAHEKDILIFGDIPIYCAMDSADAWGNRGLFQFDETGYPSSVAGVPPDAFSETGQLWGNPLYDWEKHKAEGYAWWCKRMEYCLNQFDLLRVDHFRGFESYYAVEYGAETAMVGEWREGPGFGLFQAIQKHFQKEELPIIAEDLGVITKEVEELIAKTGFPGMKILQFAFSDFENVYLPHMLQDSNSVYYTGTHDNDTLRNWFETLSDWERGNVYHYLSRSQNDWNAMTELLIKTALSSISYLCIIPAGDYLECGAEGRINAPGTAEGNWQWRLPENAFSEEKKALISDLLRTYGRFHSPAPQK